MPGYNAFIPGYTSSANLRLRLDSGTVAIAPLAGGMLGPVEVDDPQQLADAIDVLVPGHAPLVVWPEDAQDTYPEPTELEPLTVPELPQQNTDLPGPEDPALLQSAGTQVLEEAA